MRSFILLFLLIFGLSATAGAEPANEIVCVDRERMVERLVSDFGEQLAAVKFVEGEGLFEIHLSASTGTWTALLTKSDYLSCVTADGEHAPVPDFLEADVGI